MEITNQKNSIISRFFFNKQIFFSLKFSFLFLPILYLFGLLSYLIFPANFSATVSFPDYLINKIGFLISLLYFLILFLSINLCLKKINFQYGKIFYLPLYVLLVSSPLILIIFFIIGPGIIFLIFFIARLLFYFFVISAFYSLVIFLYLKNKKAISIVLVLIYFAIFFAAMNFYVNKYLSLSGCKKNNYDCINKKIISDAAQALKENNPEICHSSLNADECFFRLAISSKNSSICNYCKEDYYNRCYGYFASIDKYNIESKEKSLDKTKTDLCEKLTCTIPIRGRCKDMDDCYADSYQKEALINNDPSYCDKAMEYWQDYYNESFMLANCYMEVAIKLNDLSVCDSLTSYKDRCYFFVALKKKKDCSIIKATSGEYSKKQCEIQLNQWPYKK